MEINYCQVFQSGDKQGSSELNKIIRILLGSQLHQRDTYLIGNSEGRFPAVISASTHLQLKINKRIQVI